METSLIDEGGILQVCFVTDDLDRSVDWFVQLTGRRPVHVGDVPNAPEARAEYRGRPAGLSCRQAIFSFGGIDVEFIEPGPEPSVWRDVLERQGPGCHHIAFKTRDMAGRGAWLERQGHEKLQSGEFGGGRYAYFDTVPQLGVMLELLEFDRDRAGGD